MACWNGCGQVVSGWHPKHKTTKIPQAREITPGGISADGGGIIPPLADFTIHAYTKLSKSAQLTGDTRVIRYADPNAIRRSRQL